MPLLDHFRSPLYPRHSWESFHTRWASAIADALDRVLPARYFAEVQTHLGTEVEADVAEFERAARGEEQLTDGPTGGLAIQTWAPPVPALVMPAVFPDEFAVQVRDEREDARLVGVVELVSPRNKDRVESRRAFAVKCAAYLQRGIGLVTVDVVTTRQAILHNELIQLLNLDQSFAMPGDAALSAVAYRPVRRQEVNQIDTWPVVLALGQALPVLPLALLGGQTIPLDLEAIYSEARQRCRL
jgi:hypothetical protein